MALSTAFLFFAVLGCAVAEQSRGNPIRKVVTMLQDMQKSVENEGEKEKQLFEEFMCYCNNGAGSLDTSIATAASQIETLTGQVGLDAAKKSQMEQDIVQHKADRVEADKTIKESTAMREKEAAEFASSSGEMKANIAAMGNALAALRKGLSSASLLQTSEGQTLRNIIQQSPAIGEDDRSTMMSFLETGEGGSDQIIGVVDMMKETMEGDLKQSTAEEESAKAGFTQLVASKEAELDAASKAVEEKTARVGELAVAVVQGKADLKDTQDAMAEDEKFKANLAASCKTKQAEQDQRSKTRAEELQALSETIEMLNGDDALELFKKTMPSAAAFLQVSAASRSQQRRAAMFLKRSLARNPGSANLRVVLLALNSHAHGFGSVVKMVDGMIATNEKEQADDDKKKDFCTAELAKTEGDMTANKKAVSDLEADIAEKEDALATYGSEIAALQKGIADLDKSVVLATQQRQAEHAEYTSTSAANQAALELIGMAKNRMNKFYNPSQYKAPPTTTASSSPYGFVQVFAEYKKAESGGVLGMMTTMEKDVSLDIQEGKMDEESAQKDYEEAMKDAATKRTDDTKLMVEKEGAKAEVEVNLQAARTERGTKSEQLGLAKDKMYDLEIDCNHLLENYDETKTNRAAEVDQLKQSQSVLQGASPGFLQK